MADSGITKKALATALLELMEAESISQITIGEICKKCDMNRKSFYYHFKDKYDLIVWIYDTDIEMSSKSRTYTDIWDFLMNTCSVLDKKRKFYRKAFELNGENSLKNHFGEALAPVIRKTLAEKAETVEDTEVYMEFIKDAFVTAVEKWLNKKEPVSSKSFVDSLKESLLIAGKMI